MDPHLAKNERDVGHPGICFGDESERDLRWKWIRLGFVLEMDLTGVCVGDGSERGLCWDGSERDLCWG